MKYTEFSAKPLSKDSPLKETLRFAPHEMKANVAGFAGKQGEFWVSYIPSLNISGYGETEEEAIKDMKYNLDVFCEDLFDASQEQREIYLKELGWNRHRHFNRQFSKSFVDENGGLRDFDNPEQVKQIKFTAV